MELDIKFVPLDADLAEDGTISGYASRFGEVDMGGDTIPKGAFSRSISSGRKLKMLWNHDPSQPIGVWSDVKEDEIGLRVTGRIDLNVQQGRETYSLIKSGAVDGMSIGYRTVRARKSDDGARVLEEVDLWEVSIATFPMQLTARVDAVKGDNRADVARFKRIVESALRDAGGSSTQAKAAAATAAKSWFGRDVQADGTSERLGAQEIGRIIRGLRL